MKKATEWESEIDGKRYVFLHRTTRRKHALTVNGVPVDMEAGFLSTLIGFDEKFMLDGREARLVIERNKPDIVVNGVFLQSGKQYVKRPAWVLVFAAICILIPIVSLGGALPFLLGLGGSALCISVSKTSLPVALRVGLCVLITLAAWLLWFLLIIGISVLL